MFHTQTWYDSANVPPLCEYRDLAELEVELARVFRTLVFSKDRQGINSGLSRPIRSSQVCWMVRLTEWRRREIDFASQQPSHECRQAVVYGKAFTPQVKVISNALDSFRWCEAASAHSISYITSLHRVEVYDTPKNHISKHIIGTWSMI